MRVNSERLPWLPGLLCFVHMRRRLLVAVLVGVVPALITSALVGHFFSRTLRDALAYGPDEVTYWRQVQAYAEAGFDSGYFTIHERPAAATFTRFGPHGPAVPIFYGSIARVTGWRPYSAPLVGVALIALALAAWAFAAQPPAALTMTMIATFWPLALYVPSTMQEPLHYAIAAVCALAIGRIVRGDARAPEVAGWVAILALAGCVRPTWALAFVPMAVLLSERSALVLRITTICGAVFLALAVYLFFGWTASPYPGSPMASGAEFGLDLFSVATVFARRASRGVEEFFTSPAPALDLFVRAACLVLLAVAVAVWRSAQDARTRRTAAAIATWLAVTLAGLMAFGSIDPGRDIRVLGPTVFVALLLWAASNARSVLAATTIVQLAIAPWGLQRFERMHEPRFFGDHTRHITLNRQVRDVLHFSPGASPWTNSLLVPVDLAQDQAMLGLPAGFGTSAVLDWEALTYPPRSRYVLLGPRDHAMLPREIELVPLAETLIGTLYENRAAAP
jgi:hypothetical protein